MQNKGEYEGEFDTKTRKPNGKGEMKFVLFLKKTVFNQIKFLMKGIKMEIVTLVIGRLVKDME